MKVLFDHNVPARLRRSLTGHLIVLARTQGWQTLTNRDLLHVAEAQGFEVLLTCDQNLAYQQNNAKRNIALVVPGTNVLPPLLDKMHEIQQAIDRASPCSYEFVSIRLSSKPL